MGAVFVTGTGTDIGKTFVCAGLVRELRRAKKPVAAIKPVNSGYDPAHPAESDSGVLLTALGRPVSEEEIARVTPWRYAAPIAPHLAARREGRAIEFDEVIAFSRQAIDQCPGVLLIEGAGGIMVPLDDTHTMVDWMRALGAPVLLVAGSYLGALSHTLTCLDVLRLHALDVRAVVVNESEASTVPMADTVETIARFAAPTPVIALPRLAGAPEHPAFREVTALL